MHEEVSLTTTSNCVTTTTTISKKVVKNGGNARVDDTVDVFWEGDKTNFRGKVINSFPMHFVKYHDDTYGFIRNDEDGRFVDFEVDEEELRLAVAKAKKLDKKPPQHKKKPVVYRCTVCKKVKNYSASLCSDTSCPKSKKG